MFDNIFDDHDTDDDIFYFNSIIISEFNIENKYTLVVFNYSLENKIFFESELYVYFPINYENSIHILFCIGMCILPWYWMCFSTKTISFSGELIKELKLRKENLIYWKEVYFNILLEFMYVNNKKFHEIIFKLDVNDDNSNDDNIINVNVDKNIFNNIKKLNEDVNDNFHNKDNNSENIGSNFNDDDNMYNNIQKCNENENLINYDLKINNLEKEENNFAIVPLGGFF
jgi:hypothetical protein